MGLSYIDVFAVGRNTVYELIKKKHNPKRDWVCMYT